MLASIVQDEQVSTWLLFQDFRFPQWCKSKLFFAHGGRLNWLETFQKKKKRPLILPPVDSIDTRRNELEWQLYLEYTG